MPPVSFYQVTRSPFVQALGQLLEKARAREWRVCLRGGTNQPLAELDRQLWLGPEERFLPHGIAGGPHDADQPILLCDASVPVVGFDCLFAVHGAPVAAEEARSLQRTCVIFVRSEEAELVSARQLWGHLDGANIPLELFSDEGGHWKSTRTANMGAGAARPAIQA